MRKRIRRSAVAFTVAAAFCAVVVPAGTAQARECLGVKGVYCIPDKQCITDPCTVD